MHIVTAIVGAFALLQAVAAPGDDRAARTTPPAFEVELRTSVLARGLDVTLADLADITPANADSLAIGALKFGPAPVPGFPRTVTRTELLQTLVANGHAAGNFRFKGATEATLQSVVLEVSPQAQLDAATTVLEAVLAQEGGDVEVEPPARVRSLQVQPGRRSQELRARVRGGATNPTSAVVDVQVLVDGEVAKTVPVQFKLVRFQPVLKVNGTVRQGQPLDAGNVSVSREKVAQTTGLYLTSFEQIAGMNARRNLQPNQLLTLADVAAPAVVHRGDIVTVVITRGRVKVTLRAIANEDAGLGAPVTCVNMQSRALITGIAAASGTVVVPTN
jgi:flagella basal body P-ring formation protein FlgA